MRSPRSFMASRSWVVTDLVSSAIGSRARRGRGVELRQLALPEGPVRKLGVRDDERRLAHHPIPEADDIQVQRPRSPARSEEHTSELQSQSNLVCRLLLEKKKVKRVSVVMPSALRY